MQLTTFTFQQRSTNELRWPDDPTRMDGADDPAWAVWESACGRYRVVYDGATQEYTPQHVRVTKVMTSTHREWVAVCSISKGTLEEAQGACEQHRRRHHA